MKVCGRLLNVAKFNTHCHLAELLYMPCVLSTCALGFYWHLQGNDASFLVCDYRRTILSKFQCHTTMLWPWKRFAFQTICVPLPPLTRVLFYDSTCRKKEGAKANCLVSSLHSVLWFLLVCRMFTNKIINMSSTPSKKRSIESLFNKAIYKCTNINQSKTLRMRF